MNLFSFFRRKKPYDKLLKKIRKGKALKFEEYLKLGDYFREQGLYPKALRIHRSLELKKNLSKLEKAKLNKSLGFDYLFLYQFKEAIKHFIKADEYFKGEDEEVRKGLLRSYEFSGDWDSAIDLKRELLIANKEYSDEVLGFYILIAAEDMLKRGNYKKAKKYLKESLKYKSDLEETFLYLAELEDNLVKKLELYEKVIDKYPIVVYQKLNKLKKDFFEKSKMSELFSYLEKTQNSYMRIFYASFLLQRGEAERVEKIINELKYENKGLFYNFLLLNLAKEIEIKGQAREIIENLEKIFDEIKYECLNCNKEYINFRLRCENCGESGRIRIKIKF